jgi:hypothetical protein
VFGCVWVCFGGWWLGLFMMVVYNTVLNVVNGLSLLLYVIITRKHTFNVINLIKISSKFRQVLVIFVTILTNFEMLIVSFCHQFGSILMYIHL